MWESWRRLTVALVSVPSTPDTDMVDGYGPPMPELPCARWDADAVRRALLELLDNAIKHGREGGAVTATASSADGHVAKLPQSRQYE